MNISTLFLLSPVACFALACGETDSGAGPTANAGRTGLDGGSGGAGAGGSGAAGAEGTSGGTGGTRADAASPPAVHITGVIQVGATSEVSEGAEVCLHGIETTPCVMSGADGGFDLYPVPASADVAFNFTAPGYMTALRAVHTEEVDLSIPAGELRLETSFADPDGGITFLAVRGLTEYASGVRVSVVDHPEALIRYVDDVHDWADPNAYTATVNGFGMVLGPDPGEYRLAFETDSAGSGPCLGLAGLYGWPSPEPNEVRAPVVAGMWTVGIVALCPEAAPAVPVVQDGLVDGGTADAAAQ